MRAHNTARPRHQPERCPSCGAHVLDQFWNRIAGLMRYECGVCHDSFYAAREIGPLAAVDGPRRMLAMREDARRVNGRLGLGREDLE